MLKGKKYLLFLMHIDENRMDYGGNLIPKKGFIKANNFTYDKDIRYGLFGIPWGKTFNFIYEDINFGCWVVLKILKDKKLINVDYFSNRFKVESGLVLYSGSIKSAGRFIFKIKDNPTHFFSEESKKLKEEEIAGTSEWFKIYNKQKKLMRV